MGAGRILVTGSTGFVGRNVIEYLLARGHTVTCLMRPSSNERSLEKFRIERVHIDPLDMDSLRKNIKGMGTILHLAGLSQSVDEVELFRSNVDYTCRLASAFRESKERERFIYISSQAVIGMSPKNRAAKETDSAKPLEPYGRSKLMAENELQKFAQVFKVWVLRPPQIYGPWNTGLFYLWQNINQNKQIRIGRDYRKSLLHIFDLCSIIGQIVEGSFADREKRWNLYFITDGEEHTFKQICATAAKILNRKLSFVEEVTKKVILKAVIKSLVKIALGRFHEDDLKYLRRYNYSVTCDKARKELGYLPSYTLEKGLEQTLNWYKENGWI